MSRGPSIDCSDRRRSFQVLLLEGRMTFLTVRGLLKAEIDDVCFYPRGDELKRHVPLPASDCGSIAFT